MQNKEVEIDNNLFLKNELDANRLVSKLLCFYLIILTLLVPLNQLKSLLYFGDFIIELPIAAIICIIPIVVFYVLKNNTTWMKYLLLFSLVFVGALADGFFSYYAWIFMICPVFISSRYFSRNFTIIVAVFTLVLYFLVNVICFYSELKFEPFSYYRGNLLSFGHYETFGAYLAMHYFIKSFFFIIPAVISVIHAKNGRQLVRNQANISSQVSEIQFEFATAEKVQQHLLPNVENLSDIDSIDLSVIMKPAKQTAGDFYDFFKINDNTLAILIADVSDKGLPAAMFMMEVKQILQTLCIATKDIQSAVSSTNAAVCKQNVDCMFVTVWIGFLDITTGKCSYINAGHVPPIIIDKNGRTRFVATDPQPFIGAIENVEYTVHTFDLLADETLFLYTDGVTDAINSQGERFETARLLSILKSPTNSARELCDNVISSVHDFTQQTEQFDDITLLALKNRKDRSKTEEKTIRATNENCAVINEWIHSNLQAYCKIEETNMLVLTAVDDILSNIVEHAYDNQEGDMTIRMNIDVSSIVLTFIDSGTKFNPLEVDTPDLNDRERVGGLGIHLIKNIMDDLRYEYVDNKNILTVVKRW